MSDELLFVPNGKILFGADFLHTMLFTEQPEEGKPVSRMYNLFYSIISFFLLEWDFSGEEIDKARYILDKKIEDNTLEEINIVFERILAIVNENQETRKRFLREMLCVALLDKEISEREREIATIFQTKFDLKPSEFSEYVTKAGDWAKGFRNIGQSYNDYLVGP